MESSMILNTTSDSLTSLDSNSSGAENTLIKGKFASSDSSCSSDGGDLHKHHHTHKHAHLKCSVCPHHIKHITEEHSNAAPHEHIKRHPHSSISISIAPKRHAHIKFQEDEPVKIHSLLDIEHDNAMAAMTLSQETHPSTCASLNSIGSITSITSLTDLTESPNHKSKAGFIKWRWDTRTAKHSKVTLLKNGSQATALENDKGFLVGDVQLKEGNWSWRIKIGNLFGSVPMIAMGVVNKKQKNLWLDNLFLYKNTWGITTDGEKLVNGKSEDYGLSWLMEMGDHILFNYNATKKSLTIKYSRKHEQIVIENIEGEIYPYACLLNPHDFIITKVM